MYKRIILYFFCLQVSLFTYSQEFGLLKFRIYDIGIKKPISFAEICLFNNDTVLHCINSDFDGYFSFVVNTQNLDSLYLKMRDINETQNDCKNTTNKVFIKNVAILNYYKLSFYNIALFEFRRLTHKEYIKYCKNNTVMSGRKKVLAKDIE